VRCGGCNSNPVAVSKIKQSRAAVLSWQQEGVDGQVGRRWLDVNVKPCFKHCKHACGAGGFMASARLYLGNRLAAKQRPTSSSPAAIKIMMNSLPPGLLRGIS
jgi:hypothetical protein